MRISDRRYDRDMRRYKLAWRMIRQHVRNRAAAAWSELSIYRVKTLYAAYVATGRSPQRGAPPYQVGQFWSSLQNRTEASILAGLMSVYGVLPASAELRGKLETVGRGEQLCRAYEEFIGLWPQAQLRLEHAMLLLEGLVSGQDMMLARCAECDSLVVADRIAAGPARCAFCLHKLQCGRRYDGRAIRMSETQTKDSNRGTQGELF